LEDLGTGGNIKIDLRERGWEVVELMHVAQERNWWQGLVNMVMNLQLP
jgi:hypothetical protein